MQKIYFVSLLLALAGSLSAQPVIDGKVSASETDYQLLASFSDLNQTGFGPYGIADLYAYEDGTNLYVAITGVPEANFNKVLLMVDVVQNTGGVPAGTSAAPLTSFNGGIATFDVPDLDLVLSATRGNTVDGTSELYYSLIGYDNGSTSDVFLGGGSDDGTPIFSGDANYSTFVGAYDGDGIADVSAYDGTQAIEFSISLVDLGFAGVGGDINLMAAYTSGSADFFSANTLPEIPGQAGTNLGGDPNFTAIAGDQFVTFSAITLPVEWVGFTARPVGKEVVLEWETANETGNRGFAVERSTDGSVFNRIGYVAARGRSNGGVYSFTDGETHANVTYYYRLRQEDYDGTTTLSQVVTALRPDDGITLFPNPTDGRSVQLVLPAGDYGPTVDVDLLGLTGRRLRTERLLVTDGPLTLPTNGLLPGTYLVNVTGRGLRKTIRLSVR